MSASRWIGVLSLFGLVAGCAGSETGNGAKPRERRPVAIEFRLIGPSGALAMPDRSGTVFEIDEALIAVERVDLVLPSGEVCGDLAGDVVAYEASCSEDNDQLRIQGPWVVDLVTGAFEPPLVGVEVLLGELDRIELKLAPGEAGVAGVEPGDALDGSTLDVAGSVSLGSAVTPFGLTIDLNAYARFDDESALVIGADTDTLALSFDVQGWFVDLDLAACIGAQEVPSVDGELRLELADKQACGDVDQAVRHALAETGQARAQSNH